MIKHNIQRLIWMVIAASSSINTLHATPPTLQTPAPVIYLSDNLDEADNLGWCIDTVGRGFAEDLHAHSCKPKGGDVQFSYNPDSLQIASATYENKCAVLKNDASVDVQLGLVDCDANASLQQFTHSTEAGTIHPKSDESLCLAVGENSQSAGPFMSRTLMLASCEKTDTKLIHWTIVDKPIEPKPEADTK